MPLLKLWKSIRGRSASQRQAPVEPTETANRQTADEPEPSASPAAPTDSPTNAREPWKKNGKATSRRKRLSLFGGSQSHAALRKLVKPLSAKKVLEISVGDGSRAVAVIETLPDSAAVRYMAIDQFEMAGGAVTLKGFHQTLRSAGIRPQVFPDTIDRGLQRVAHTVGPVDLVLIAVDASEWQNMQIVSLVRRVSHEETIVLYQDDDSWLRYEWQDEGHYRRAA